MLVVYFFVTWVSVDNGGFVYVSSVWDGDEYCSNVFSDLIALVGLVQRGAAFIGRTRLTSGTTGAAGGLPMGAGLGGITSLNLRDIRRQSRDSEGTIDGRFRPLGLLLASGTRTAVPLRSTLIMVGRLGDHLSVIGFSPGPRRSTFGVTQSSLE